MPGNSKASLVIVLAIIFIASIAFSSKREGFPQVTGSAVSQLSIVERYQKTCSFPMIPGWNLICIPCIAANTKTETGLEQIWNNSENNSQVLSIHTYRQEDSEDHWKSHKPFLPDYVVQDLAQMQPSDAYFVNMKNKSRVNLTGNLVIPKYIMLYQGWNLAGYAANDTTNPRSIALAFTHITDSIIEIRDYSNGTYLVYNSTRNDFLNIYPYKGYWIKMQDNKTWQIDW